MKRATCSSNVAGRFIALVTMSLFCGSLIAQEELNGQWQTGEDNSVVEITETDGVAVGRLLSSDNSKAVIGTEILSNLTPSGNSWKGKIYAVKRHKMMDATIVSSTDTLQIKVSAGPVHRNVTWTRVKQ